MAAEPAAAPLRVIGGIVGALEALADQGPPNAHELRKLAERLRAEHAALHTLLHGPG